MSSLSPPPSPATPHVLTRKRSLANADLKGRPNLVELVTIHPGADVASGGDNAGGGGGGGGEGGEKITAEALKRQSDLLSPKQGKDGQCIVSGEWPGSNGRRKSQTDRDRDREAEERLRLDLLNLQMTDRTPQSASSTPPPPPPLDPTTATATASEQSQAASIHAGVESECEGEGDDYADVDISTRVSPATSTAETCTTGTGTGTAPVSPLPGHSTGAKSHYGSNDAHGKTVPARMLAAAAAMDDVALASPTFSEIRLKYADDADANSYHHNGNGNGNDNGDGREGHGEGILDSEPSRGQ